MNPTTFFSKLVVYAVILIAALSVNYIQADWSAPPNDPPTGNVDAPVNIGTTDQVKDAGLTVNALAVFGAQYIQDSLSIGSETVSSDLLLDVEGKIGATQYCDQDGNNCGSMGGGAGGSTYDLLWNGNAGGGGGKQYGTESLSSGKQFSDYDALFVMGRAQYASDNDEVAAQGKGSMYIDADIFAGRGQGSNPYMFEFATFSGNDSGAVGIMWLSDTTFQWGTYRYGRLDRIYGITYD